MFTGQRVDVNMVSMFVSIFKVVIVPIALGFIFNKHVWQADRKTDRGAAADFRYRDCRDTWPPLFPQTPRKFSPAPADRRGCDAAHNMRPMRAVTASESCENG
jgi:hypothetical protein